MCVVLSIGARAQFSGSGNGTAEDPYRIYTDIHLAQIANFLNQEGVVFELMKDVDLSSYISENSPSQGWTPIGVASTPFKGVLKGNNHTISGLYVKRSNADNVGLFGYISGATIQDLSITALSIEGKDYVGAFVGYSISSTLKNITITVSGQVNGNDNVGGIIGYANGTNVSNAVLNTRYVHGESYVGGVIGYANEGSIKTCTATYLDTSSSSIVGGIAGCLSSNTVSSVKSTGNVSGTTSVGGAFGQILGTNTLDNVTSIGDIEGTANVSGIAGELATSSIVTFISCSSKGKITNSGDYTGGIVGKSNGVCINSMDDCSHFGDIKGQNYVGGLVGAVLKIDAVDPTSTYQIRSGSNSSSTVYATYSDQVVTGGTATRKLNNCTAIGNIEGNDYVGGLVGESLYASSYYTSSSLTYTYTYTGDWKYIYFWKNGVYVSYKGYDRSNLRTYYCDYPQTIYTKGISTISLLNSYYSGNISATKYVGGLIGHQVGGDIQNCYTYSTINGAQNVGGIAGLIEGYSSTQHAVVKSTVANNASVTATAANVGRIYGSSGDYITIGALASAEGNRALTQTKVMLCGVAQDVIDDEQNGTSVGPSMLRLKANYVSWGWNFDDNWNILETECYPYKKYQAAPPVIESSLKSQDTNISGKSVNGGTVYMYYKDRDAVSTDCDGYNWAFTTEALQSGAQVQLYADVDGMTPSYLTSTTVGYPGSGTEADPYRIYTAEDLQGASNRGYYKLMNDIDLSAWINENSPTKGWVAIGRNSGEATCINGDGHKVTGLWINTTEDYTGLFSNFSAGTIKNLTVEVANGKKVKGGDYTGVLIGRNANGQLLNCTVKGDVEGTKHVGGVTGYSGNNTINVVTFEGKVSSISNDAYVGGFTGLSENDAITAVHSYSTISTTGTNNCVGGAIGYMNGGTITRSNADNSLIARGANNYVGGLVGNSKGGVTLSYSTGIVRADGSESYTGGLVGYTYNPIANCYSTAATIGSYYTGGLCAYTYSTIDKCYAKGDIYGSRYGGGVVAQLDGTNSALTNSIAINNKLELTDQSAWGSRVIGGFKNGAAEPTLGSNYALNTMQVSLNNMPQKKTDDNIEGVAKPASELLVSNTYIALGWDFYTVWGIEETENLPYLLWEIDINPVADITLSKSSLILPVGNTATITANILPLSATNKRVAWTTSNSAVATVADGIVTATGLGNATITATTTDGSNLSATCSVSVVANHDAAIAELQTLVDNALALYNNSSEGTEIGQYAVGSRATFYAVINAVQNEISGTMTESAISDCTTRINNAVAEFQSKKVSAGEDTNISDMSNVMYCNNLSIKPGARITIPVCLKNTAEVTAFSFEMTLPQGLTVAKNDRGKNMITLDSGRKSDSHTLSSNITSDGTVYVSTLSLGNETFIGSDGIAVNVTIDVAENIEAGDYPLIIKNIVMGTPSNEKIKVPYVKSTVTVVSYTPGDVDNDGEITIVDAVGVVNFVIKSNTTGLNEIAADADLDGEVTVVDAVWIINKVIHADDSKARSQRPKGLNAGLALKDKVMVAGEAFNVPVVITDNACNVTAGQFVLCLPEGVALTGVSTDINHVATAQVQDDGTYRIACLSLDNSTFIGGCDAMVTLHLQADLGVEGGEMIISDAELVSPSLATTRPDAVKAQLAVGTTGIYNISSDNDADAVYDLSGRKVNNVNRGVYIVNGKKTIK